MASVRTYSIVYVALLALGTAKFVLFELEQYVTYTTAIGITLILALCKVLLIMGYFQHLKDEPRSITYLMASAVFMVILLTIAAGFSIQ